MLQFGLVIDAFCLCSVGISERAWQRTYRGIVATRHLRWRWSLEACVFPCIFWSLNFIRILPALQSPNAQKWVPYRFFLFACILKCLQFSGGARLFNGYILWWKVEYTTWCELWWQTGNLEGLIDVSNPFVPYGFPFELLFALVMHY
jgi:hypothetical protein